MQYSVVQKKCVNQTETLRFDAEYFEPKYLKIIEMIEKKSKDFTSMDQLGLKIDASAFYPALEPYYNEGNLPFIRVQDTDIKIDYDNCIKIPESIIGNPDFSTLKITNLGDIVITKGGSIARIGFIEKRSAVCRDLIFLNSSILSDCKYKFLYIYCLSYVYKNLLIRSSSMTAQPHLTITLVKDIPIYNPKHTFKIFIASLFDKVVKLDELINSNYKNTEKILLNELGLQSWQPNHGLSYVKNFSDINVANRLDAEYFQPKYDELVEKIKSYPNGWNTLNKLVKLRDKNFTPEDEKEYNYIELANINSNGSISNIVSEVGKNLPTRARRIVKTGDVIVSSIEGSLDSVALITPKYNDSLCSTGFYVMHSDEYNSETLFCLMKSIVGQMQLKKGCSGTILTAINNDELSKIILPKIDNETQNQIKEKISEMYICMQKSKQLLEVAKCGVEKAIEENEDTAMTWINGQLKQIGVIL